jgi:hypothetical protein
MDNIELYKFSINNKIAYTCKFCDYNTDKKCNIEKHILRTSHKQKRTTTVVQPPINSDCEEEDTKSIKSISEVISSELEIKNNELQIKNNELTKKIEELMKLNSELQIQNGSLIKLLSSGQGQIAQAPPPPVQTEPTKLSSKQYLITNCKDAVKIDITPNTIRYGRMFEINNEDLLYAYSHKINDYVFYIFKKLYMKVGKNNFPFRCSAVSRKKFYYNDVNEGWIEDIGHGAIFQFIHDFLASTACSVPVTFAKQNKLMTSNDGHPPVLYLKLKLLDWGIDYTDDIGGKQCTEEKLKSLVPICSLLQINED